MVPLCAILLLAFASVAPAQDERRVSSPNGKTEFRLFVGQPEAASLSHLAYQIYFGGKLLIDTSFLGLEIHNQEPRLGENLGLIASKTESTTRYNSLTAEYMQNGSLGRRINVEVRAYDDAIAFRYIVPKSTPLDEILLDNDATEFAFVPEARIPEQPRIDLPFTAEAPRVGWFSISEVRPVTFPRMYLTRTEGNVLLTRLEQHEGEPSLALEGATPLTCPWRVVVMAPVQDDLKHLPVIGSLRP